MKNIEKNIKKTTKKQEKIAKNFPSVKKDKNVSQEKTKKGKAKTAAIIALSITTGLLSLTGVGLGIGLGITSQQAEEYGNRLEGVYQKSFYDLVDNVNNAEINLSKVLASSGDAYTKKMLTKVSDNASDAQVNFASLPLSQNSLDDIAALLNQVAGYTQTLNEKLASGQELTSSEIETLGKIHTYLVEIKSELNDFAIKIRQGYRIIDEGIDESGENNFTISMSKMKSVDVDYPTMIYDGPFSDSVTNVPVKGLSGKVLGKQEVKEKIEKLFKNIVSIEFEEDTQGKFDTYNFRLRTSDNEMLYIQATQRGGYLLTVSGKGGDSEEAALDISSAQEIAVKFAKDNGIENPLVVWTDEQGDNAYFNIAPTQNGVVLYPDLVKVKIDLTQGTVIGYDAVSYFTNHEPRVLPKATADREKARAQVPKGFVIVAERVVLAPLEYNRQELCYEFAATKDEHEYYFYINAVNGQTENILRVIETENGNKLL